MLARRSQAPEVQQEWPGLRGYGSDGSAGTEWSYGDNGPAWPPGAPAIDYWALVSDFGDLVTGTATGVSHPGTGQYSVCFGRSVTNCAAAATLARVPGGFDPNPATANIVVNTTSGRGSRARAHVQLRSMARDFSFHLIVAC